MATIENWDWEYTDTFGCAPNYSWVKRGTVQLPAGSTHRDVTRAVKRAAGLTGAPGRTHQRVGDADFRPSGSATILQWWWSYNQKSEEV